MFSEERRKQILETLEREGRVLVKELAEQFEVSIDSIRRDLSIMENDQQLKRTHGGAIPLPAVRSMPRNNDERFGESTSYQKEIAERAAAYIHPEQTVFIGGASIHFAMIPYLPKEFSFTVVTNSVEIAYQLREFENIHTYVIGGKMKVSGNITDPLAAQFAERFHYDLCFATGGGLTARGLSTATPEVALFHEKVYENSRRIITLVEHTKVGADLFTSMYPLKKLDIILTDEATTSAQVDELESHGVKIIKVPKNK
ncbi:DeoR/GlpR transcriptional regulator [Rossellomorea vietnamensis]|uniref:DeoR/GlpR transcriptional regulator n=1 Tax=Rossellomorea vietnamensis TaxID=218284 RepID=A0A5D4NL53_9BACI|nr:DeoR/GlpR family DNA-binding transcription regulator [Rossellomorea vietnamensis]TYS15013.1 DeoR/GlpR transcriptional regulator [Rossellomorea vietnamensis]